MDLFFTSFAGFDVPFSVNELKLTLSWTAELRVHAFSCTLYFRLHAL